MKLSRLLGAICAALLLIAPARAAEQLTTVMPVAGPMDMATFAGKLNDAHRAMMSCSWGTSAPANGPSGAPIVYQCWADTTSNPVLLKRYDGASWVAFGSLNTSTHVWLPYLTGGTSGGIPYFSATGVMGSSALLVQYGLVVGGGAGAAPATIAACTDDQIPFGRTSNNPLCRTVTGDITFLAGASSIGANKVTNAMFATMAANTTKCNATAGSAVPTDCSASTMRTNIGVVIGTNVQAWDADLDCLAALSTNGIIARSGAGTCAGRTITAPAAGITFTNGDGVSGNPTLSLANDLAALEALSSTGIARRTGTDAWSVGTAVANSELATMAANTIKANATGGSAGPTDVAPAAARSSSLLNVDSFTGHGDSTYTILSTDRTVGTNAAFTASRTWTLPAANAVNPGQEIIVADYQGTVTGTNTLVISRAGSDTVNGGTAVTITAANGAYLLKSDGVSKWTAQALGAAAGGGVSSVTCFGSAITTSGTCATAATKSDEQTGSSATAVVTPSQQQQHDSAAKAWCSFTAATAGTNACAGGSYNVTNVTKTSAGIFAINFATAFASTSYACQVTPQSSTTSGFIGTINSKSTGHVDIFTLNATSAATDPTGNVDVVCFGRQ